ncbi:MAG TPA: Gfo/Idh/MocA family oxidoreductase [Beutenbergiaceae bacterium]|nr:Gfo/Idh/MocA family oxidoreductase [Beutenbergiaceae bacterium]
MTGKQIRAAVIGTGFIGGVHAEAVRRAGGHVVGVLGSSPQRAAEPAARLGVAAYGSMRELLEDESVDVVHIASPNALHAQQAAAVLDAGKHVICEKPLTTTLAEARELHALAERRGLVNAVCYNLRFYPLVHEAASRVASGDLGTLRLVTGSYLQDWMLWETDWNWRIDPATAGPLRAVADIGSHWLDASSFVVGAPIESVYAQLHTFVPVRQRPTGERESFAEGSADEATTPVQVGTDDAAQVLLRYANGARGALTVSQVSAGRKNTMSLQLDGSESALAWSSESPDELWLGHRGRPNEVLHRDPGELAPEAAAITFYPGGHVEGFGETFRGLFERVYADIARGRPSSRPAYPTFADGRHGLAVLEAIHASAAQEVWVDVERMSTS